MTCDKNAYRLFSVLVILLISAAVTGTIGCAKPQISGGSTNADKSVPAPAPTPVTKYPSRPVTMIVPWAVGGASDLEARIVSGILGGYLTQPVVVVNKPGGAGVTGSLELAKAAPDGYTLGVISQGMVVTQFTSLQPTNIDDYTYVSGLSSTTFALIVKAESPWKTLKDFVDYAKANPGKIKIGNTGVAGAPHLFAGWIEKEGGIKLTHVPFNGFAGASAAVTSGEVESVVTDPASVDQLVKQGKLRILGIGTEKKSSFFHEAPTFKEQGMNISWYRWTGVLGPKGLHEDVLKVLREALLKVGDSAEYAQYMKQAGAERFAMEGDEFYGFAKKDAENTEELVNLLGIKPK